LTFNGHNKTNENEETRNAGVWRGDSFWPPSGFARKKLTDWWVKGFIVGRRRALPRRSRNFRAEDRVKVDLSQYAVQDNDSKSVAALDSGTPPDIAYSTPTT